MRRYGRNSVTDNVTKFRSVFNAVTAVTAVTRNHIPFERQIYRGPSPYIYILITVTNVTYIYIYLKYIYKKVLRAELRSRYASNERNAVTGAVT